MRHRHISRALRVSAFTILVILAPNNLPSQTHFWERINSPSVSTTRALAINSSGHIFAAGSGVFRSTDDGGSWTQILPGSINTAVISLAINPSGIIFAGTFKGGGYTGRLLRSTDNGMTWIDTGLPNLGYYALAMNRNGDVWAGTEYGGVFRSTDGGVTWVNIWSTTLQVWCIAIDSSGDISAGTGDGGIFLSTDNGGSWSQINTGLPWEHPAVFDLSINSRGELFAAVDFINSLDETPLYGGVFRSTDHGATWVEMNHELTDNQVVSLGINSSDHLFAGTWGGVVSLSRDNGETWINTALPAETGPVLSFAINSSGRLFAGTSSGKIFRTVQSTTGVEKTTTELPTSFRLEQNYPNPFNPSTTIQFSLPKFGNVTLKIFNLLGEEVATLVDENLAAGNYSTEWRAEGMSSGIYIYRITTGSFVETKKMTLVK